MESITGVVFDMDDVLYLERDYVRSGFSAVAHELANRQAEVGPSDIFGLLWSSFENGIRGDSFDRLLYAMPLLAAYTDTSELVQIYREHVPDIQPCSDAIHTLASLKRAGIRTGLISDGSYAVQARKLTALGLRAAFDTCILTDGWGREYWKPHDRAFHTIANQWGVRPEQLIYIGDNPRKDFLAPRRLGWTAVRLRKYGQIYGDLEADSTASAPHLEITQLSELYEAISRLGDTVERATRSLPISGLSVAYSEAPTGATACT